MISLVPDEKAKRGSAIKHPASLNIINKLVKSANGVKPVEIDFSSMQGKIDTTSTNINDNTTMLQMLPDLELAKQILVSSILSPQDLNSLDLMYSVVGDFEDVPVVNEMLSCVKEYFETTYRIKEELPIILSKALFEEGAYVKVVVPESELQRVIDGDIVAQETAVRSHFTPNMRPIKSLGIIGPSKKTKSEELSLESLFSPIGSHLSVESDVEKRLKLSISDNPEVLRLPSIIESVKRIKIKQTFESNTIKFLTENSIKKDRKGEVKPHHIEDYMVNPMVALHKPTGAEIGENDIATIIDPYMESVIPVYGSNPSQHVGYWIVTDNTGYPLRKAKEKNYYNEFNSKLNASNRASSSLNQSMNAMFGREANARMGDEDSRLRAYEDIIEAELTARLKNGIYQEDVTIAKQQEIYKVMLSRALRGQATQLIYVPVELVTYFAFEYNDEGIGVSLLEKTKIIGSIRAMLLLSDTMSHTRNSIGRTSLEIEFDGTEADPAKLLEFTVQEYLNSRSPMFPLGEPNPVNLVSYLQRAGVEVKTSGHPALPETKVNIDNFNTSMGMVDTEHEEKMKRRQYMGLGLSPDIIDEASELDLATSVVKRDLLLTKRIITYQGVFTPQLSKHIRTVTKYTGTLVKQLHDILVDSKVKLPKKLKKLDAGALIERFIDNINVNLPKPDGVTLENQMSDLAAYSSAIEEGIEYYFSDMVYNSDTLGDDEVGIEIVKGQIHSMLVRRYMRSNNILPELDELVALDDDKRETNPIIEELKLHTENISKNIGTYMDEIAELLQKRELAKEEKQMVLDKKREEAEAKLEDKYGDEDEDDSGDTDNSGDDSGDSDDGEDDSGDLIGDDDTDTSGDSDDGDDLIGDDEDSEDTGDDTEEEEDGEDLIGDDEDSEDTSDDDGEDLIDDDDSTDDDTDDSSDDGDDLIQDEDDDDETDDSEEEEDADEEDDEGEDLI